MRTKTFGLIALLVAGVLTLTGCGKNEAPIEENVELANPASVYCEENGGTLVLEEWAWLCMFHDGSYCEERAFKNGECRPGEIMYNVISEDEIPEPSVTASELYSEEDILVAQDTIMNVINNEWEVKVEWVEFAYAGDDVAMNNLE